MTDLFNEHDVSDLEFTKKLRKEALEALTENGPLPDSKKGRIFIDLLDGLDRQILAKASIKTQDEGNKNTAMLAAQLLLSIEQKSNKTSTRTKNPALPDNIDPNDVPGELDIDPGDLSLDEILAS